MIVTLNDKKDDVVLTKLVAKEDKKAKIENLHYLYSTIDFEKGYIQHGQIWWYPEIPKKDTMITEENIQGYNTHTWGIESINGRYPVEHFTTKAKNTLIIIREILELNSGRTFNMKSFFDESSKEVTPYGLISTGQFDLSMQIKKLNYLLANKELALSLLKDAYLDFYLFVDLLTNVYFETFKINSTPDLFEHLKQEATENTQILSLANEFAGLNSKE